MHGLYLVYSHLDDPIDQFLLLWPYQEIAVAAKMRSHIIVSPTSKFQLFAQFPLEKGNTTAVQVSTELENIPK